MNHRLNRIIKQDMITAEDRRAGNCGYTWAAWLNEPQSLLYFYPLRDERRDGISIIMSYLRSNKKKCLTRHVIPLKSLLRKRYKEEDCPYYES